MARSGMSRATTASLSQKKKERKEDIFQGSPGEWAMPRSAEELLDRQRQRVDDVPAHALTVHHGVSQKRLEEDFS